MAQATKRSRIAGASAVSNEVREEMDLRRINRGANITRSDYSRGGANHTKTTSKQYGKKRGKLSGQDITDLLCPIFTMKRIGYGNRWEHRDWDGVGTEIDANNFVSSNSPGTCRTLAWEAGRQAWAEFVAMPITNPGNQQLQSAGVNFLYDPFSVSTAQLMIKARNIRNNAENLHITAPTDQTQFFFGDVIANAALSSAHRHSMSSFEYLDGYQEHQFININSTECTIYVQELQPRNMMSGISLLAQATPNRFGPNTVATDLLEDYKLNLPLSNTSDPAYIAAGTNNDDSDTITDLHVKINKNSNRVHMKWLVGKEIKVVLQPGDRFTHRVTIDPYSFTDTAWMRLADWANINVNGIGATGSGAPTGPLLSQWPVFMPSFTKVLCVRAHGPMGWGTANADGSGAVTSVGTVNGCVTHTMTEYHSCRMMPFMKRTNFFLDNRLDQTASRVINRETDEAELMETNGTADDPTQAVTTTNA